MVLYPEDDTHVACMEKLEQNGYTYCAILHAEDEYDTDDAPTAEQVGQKKKPHWHVVLSLKNPRFRNPLADELGIKPNYIEVCRNRDGSLLYLVHDGYPNKYQYDPACCFGSLAPMVNKLLVDESESSRVLRVLDVLDTLPCPATYRQLIVKCCELELYGDLRRMGSGVIRLLDEHNHSYYVNEQYKADMRMGRERVRPYVESVTPFDALPRLSRQGMLTVEDII